MSQSRAPRPEDDHPTVDVSLIDAMLELTPEQRLRQNDQMLRTIQELRDGFAARRTDDDPDHAGRGGR